MKVRRIPREARRLRTYAEFQSYLADFARGTYPFLWVVGRPGAGKTESIRAATRGQAVYYRKGGQITPAQFYRDLYEHRGQPIILDDSEHLLENALGAKLICALGDTSPVKQLSYATTSRVLGETPQVFSTTSPLCIIANRNTNHEAIRSRAITIYFDPTNLEIHQAAAAWYWDQEIHNWFGAHLYRLEPMDVRWLVIATQDKKAGRDWRRIILSAHAIDRASTVVQDLEVDPTCPTREDKARRFNELMGESRATYFRIRKRLEDEQRLVAERIAPIPLRHTRPPAPPSDLELESLSTPPAPPPEVPTTPLDLPLRAEFAQPIRGTDVADDPPARPALDDSLPWETPPTVTDEEEAP